VAFGVGHHKEALRRLEPYWTTRPRTLGEKMMAAVAALFLAHLAAPADDCVDLTLAALEGGELIAADSALMTVAAIFTLVLADRDEALDAWEASLADAHERGSLFSAAALDLWRGFTLYRRGELPEAEERLRAAAEEFELYGYGLEARIYCAGFLAAVLLERGDLEGAREALALTGPPGYTSNGGRFWLDSRLDLLVAEGRDAEALEAAEEFARSYGWIRNPVCARWRSAEAQVLARRGRHADAVALVEEELELTRSFGAPGAVGTSLLILGELERDRGTEHLREAIEVLEGSPARLELAKALCALGTALRLERKPREAREPLRRALEIATVCGADGVADRARAELRAAGARPRREALTGVGSLTPSERRVAAMAAEGLTNRDIAQALYVTPKTIEVHLSNAYRKLEIGSRRELAGALAPPG
jgi:DNA-binding CsgD family transcriptional regulator